ncbi:hypothetical protein OG235_37305 [Streptomyces sp. NBC_00024]|uniref:hypothetical protein n=1 Tax=Streptomyces sp. NBC_00024 TaxID=2903612 RepID=UPI00324900F3
MTETRTAHTPTTRTRTRPDSVTAALYVCVERGTSTLGLAANLAFLSEVTPAPAATEGAVR